jgi:agmatinase
MLSLTTYSSRLNDILNSIASMFTIPEKTKAKTSFADVPKKISFHDSMIALYGVPLEITTSFGKGTKRGPEAIRISSARQIETLIFEENTDISQLGKVFDLGDLKMPYSGRFVRRPSAKSFDTYGRNESRAKKRNIVPSAMSFLNRTIPQITRTLYYDARKMPFLLGGEHTLAYYSIKALAKEKPMILHFDAHRDMKEEYDNMKMCHTTPFFHLISEGHIEGKDLIQIGIRQSDNEENMTARKSGVTTLDAWAIHDNLEPLLLRLNNLTKCRKIYISFDIDVYDLPYVPCTGTPEPFGLSPFEVVRILKSIHKTAKLVGMDMVEVSAKAADFREGTLATHTIYRILVRDFAKNNKCTF